jgi:hypothetical protein
MRVGNKIFYPMAEVKEFRNLYTSTADYGKKSRP